MKATLSVEHLKPILKMLAKSGPSELWLLAADDSLILTIDSKGARWSLRCPAEVSEEGNCYLSWSRFVNIASALEDLSVILDSDDKTLTLTTDLIRASLPVNSGSLFPVQRQINESAVASSFEMPTFSSAVRAAMAVIGKPDAAFSYTGSMSCLVTPSSGIITATDRKRILCRRFLCRGDSMEFMVPAVQLDLIASFPDATVEVASQENNVRLKSERFIADLSPINSRMPEFRTRFLKDMHDAPVIVTIDYGSFVSGLSLAHSAADDRINVNTYLDLSPTGSRIRSNGDREDEIDIRLEAQSSAPVRIWVMPDQIGSTFTHLHKTGAVADTITLRTGSEPSTLFFPLSDDMEDFLCVSAFVPPVNQ